MKRTRHSAEQIVNKLREAEVFDGLHDAKALADTRRQECNHRRPRSSLEYLPPVLCAARLAAMLAVPPAQPACSATLTRRS
jgi:hypothetical protein